MPKIESPSLPHEMKTREVWTLTAGLGTMAGLVAVFGFLRAPMYLGLVSAGGLIAIVLVLRPGLALIGTILLSSLYLISDDGVGLGEIVYFTAFGVVMVPAAAYALLTGNLELDQSLNRWMLALTLLVAAYAVVGYLNGANPSIIAGDLTFYSFIFAYFAVRGPMRDSTFARSAIVSLIAICLYVLLQNFLNYQQILLEATMAWQAENARSATREILLVLGAAFFFSLSGTTKNLLARLASLSMLGLFIVGLVITQSRGYWIACLIALTSVVLVAEPAHRRRLILIAGILVALLTAAILLFLRDELMIVLYGLADRFLSFRDLSQDVSLKERLLESRTILDRMAYNPIAGYGLGVTYDRYYMVLGNIIPTSFIHNGYLSAWFKLGLPGLAVCLAIMALLVTGTFRWIRQGHADMTRLELTMAMAMFGVLISMLVVNVTSAQFYSFEGWMVLTLHAAYLSHRIGGRDGEATEAYDPAESMATSDPASTSATSKRSPSGER